MNIQEIMKLWDRVRADDKKLLLFALSVLIIVFLDTGLFLNYQIQAIRRLNPKITKLKADINTLKEGVNRMEGVKSAQTASQAEALQRYKRALSEEEVPRLLQDISEKARQNNVKILQMRPAKQPLLAANLAEMRDLVPLLIALDLSCGYHQLGRFINDLEEADNFIAVEEMSIGAQEGNYLVQKVDLILRSYVKK